MDTQSATTDIQTSAGAELRRNWLALLAAIWGASVGLTGLMFYSFSTFVPLFEAREGWSRAAISISMLVPAIGILLGGPIVGRIIDAVGVRRVLIVAIPLLAIGFVLPGLATGEPWTLWAGYLGLSILGVGASPIAYARLLTARFHKARGLALGAMLAGTGVSALFVPPYLAWVTDAYGILGGYLALSALALTPWLAFAFFIKDTHIAQQHAATPSAATATGGGRLKAFIIGASFFVASLGLAGVVVHLVAMVRDAGLDAQQAALVASGVGLGVICARVFIGWTLDHVYAPTVGLVVFAIAAFGCLLLAYGGTGFAAIAAVLIGVAIGGEIDLIAYLVSRYFPPQRFAYMYGWQFGIFTIGAGLSPVLIEVLRGDDGSYVTALTFAAASVIVGGLPLFALGKYRY